MKYNINEFVEDLCNETNFAPQKKYRNPWKEQRNKENLLNFLNSYKEAKFILIGEAPGRKGCLQCGVPFCDDYTLEKLINVSKNKKSKETSAQRIYNAFKNDFIAWNAFPYQPCNDDGSNRHPTIDELKFGKEYLKKFLDIFYNETKELILLGDKAKIACEFLDLPHKEVLHPSCKADNKRKELGFEHGMNGWLKYIHKYIPDLKY